MIPYSDNYILQYVAKLTTKEYTDGLEKMEGKTSESTGKINKNFDSMSSFIGKAIKSKFSLAAAALYLANKTRLAIQDMIAFQKQLSTVNTLLKASREELNNYADEFINLSIRTGQAKEDIANGAYQALSSGIAKEDLIGFLETATKTAQAGLTTTENSIKTISSIMNAYKMSTKEAGEVADWLLTVQNKGVTTVDELGASLADVTSISSALEVSLNDVGAALAQMTQNGNNTAKSTTMLKTMLSELSKSGQQAADIFSTIAGQSFRSFIINGGNLQDALNMLDEYAKKSNKSISDLFSSVEAGNAALNLTGINAEKFSEKLNDMKNKSGELNTAYQIATRNIKSEWDKLTQAMNSRWRDLVSWLEEPIYITIKEIRQVIDGQDNAIENLEDNKKRRAELEAEQQEKLKRIKSSPTIATDIERIGKEIGKLNEEILRAENEIAQKAYNENLKQYQKYREDLSKYLNGNHKGQEKEIKRHLEEVQNVNEELLKSDKTRNKKELTLDKQQIEAKIDILNERIKINSELQSKEIELKQKQEDKENSHKENLRNSELKYLEDKKRYLEEQNNLLNKGIISKDEYQRNVIKKDKELLNTQKQANIESLKDMENYYKQVNDIKKANEYHKKVVELEIDVQKNNSSISIEEIEKTNKAIELKEKEHKNNLNQIEIDYLSKKNEFVMEQKRLLNLGVISKDEYDRNIKIKDRELLEEQQKSNLAVYQEMEDFYKKLGDLNNANEFKKKVIEVELQITQNTTLDAEANENLFLQAEAEKRKEYQAELLANEWEYLTQLAEMRENGSINETQIEEFKERRMGELELARLEREAEELQNRLNFYNSSEDYKQQAVDTLQKIEENALKRENLQDKKKLKLSEMTANLLNDVQKRSKDTLLDSYEMIAKGQMKSLDDFKKFATMQLAEVMLSHGKEAMIRGMSDTVIGISFAANPATASRAPAEFASAAKNFAFSAAMGVGANALYSASSSDEEKYSDNEKTSFDQNINDRVENANKESEGTVYIDVSDSQMAKVMIKQIEKELKDGYNVTLVGKKKK